MDKGIDENLNLERRHKAYKFVITKPDFRTFTISAIFIMVVFSAFLGNGDVKAAAKTLNNDDIVSGISEYSELDTSISGNISLQKGDLGKWSGSNGNMDMPFQIYSDADMIYGPSGTLYLMSGYYNATRFARYEIETKKWQNLANPPISVWSGNSIVYDGQKSIYSLPGGKTDKLFKYDISSDSWTTLASAPFNVDSGAKFVYTSMGTGYIYGLRGGGSNTFWRYDVLNNSWSQRASFTNTNAISYGFDLVWSGGDAIYGISNVYNEFKKYSISANSWSNLKASPSTNRKNRLMVVDPTTIISVQLAIFDDTAYLSKYNVTTDLWTSLAKPPTSSIYDYAVTAAYDGVGNIYTILGSETVPSLNKYTVSTDSWNVDTSLFLEPSSFWHERLVFDNNNYVYYQAGAWSGTLDRLVRLDLATGQKSVIGAYPTTGAKPGWAGTYSGGNLYWMSWTGTNNFYRFNLTTNDWETLAVLPSNDNWGADIVDGGDGYLYSTMGSSNVLYRYDIAKDVWEPLNNTTDPASQYYNNTAPYNIYVGGGMTRIGRTIYVTPGNNEGFFMKYDIDSASKNKWTSLNKLPVGGIQHGGAISSDGSRYVYVVPASWSESNERMFMRYDTVSLTWKRMADLPGKVRQRSSMFYNQTNGKIYFSPAADSHYLWNWAPTTATYVTTGTWYSKSYDFTQVQSWSSLSATVVGASSASFYTQSSDDGKIWSTWQAVIAGSIYSPPKRFIRIKATLTGGGVSTPTVSNIAIDYNQETAPPSLPVQLIAKSDVGGQALESGQTHESQHPYFEWTGASDGANGSGVDGYYVYFGTDSGADPAIAGNYQKQSNYTVTYPMDSGSVYYLRLKVKDKLGNVSTAGTYFSYRYWYISPPGTFMAASQGDYMNGVSNNVDVSSNPGTMSIRKNDNGSWSTGDVKAAPSNVTGGATSYARGYIYTVKGSNTNTFWRYDTENQVWSTLNVVPATVNRGSTMTWDGDNYLYLLRGNNSSDVYRYSISGDTWLLIGQAPSMATAGTDIKYVGNNRLAVMFVSGDFYIYETNNGNWRNMTSQPFVFNCGGADGGSGMYYDGSDSIYAYFGGDWCAGRGFAKYSLSQDTWTALSQPSYQAYYMQQNLTSDGRGNLYIFGQDTVRYGKVYGQKYNISSNTWSSINSAYTISSYGTQTSDGKRYLYLFPAYGSNQKLVRYDTWDDRFTPLGFEPAGAYLPKGEGGHFWQSGNASTIAYDGLDSVFLLGGSERSYPLLAKYSISQTKYEYLPPPPFIGYGGSMRYLGGYIYYVPGYSTKEIYRYNPGMKIWARMNDAPDTIYRPGSTSLVADSVGNLYVPRGNSTTYYKFVPSDLGGTWSTLTAMPGALNNGSATYDGAGNIYVLRSNGTSAIYKYNITANTWSTLAAMPGTIAYGGTITENSGKLFVTQGGWGSNMYVFDTNFPLLGWSTGASTPESFRDNAAMIKIDSKRALGFAGSGSPNIWQFVYPSANTSYMGRGSHVSPSIRVDGIFDYASIKAGINLPTNTKVELWTRTSDDNNNWDEWTIAGDLKYYSSQLVGRVKSTPRKFVQIRIDLYSFDNMYTPTVSNYSLDYYFDTQSPENPSILKVYSDNTKTQVVDNNVWVNHQKPIFDWPDAGQVGGPTDGELGSRIKGYYVYFGKDETALPQTAGVFVNKSEYEASPTTPGSYFFRLQTVDMTGNIQADVFSPYIYKFDAIPPETPPFITVTPSGFTAKNEFSFEWPNAFDGESGISEYCYRTGASSGAFSVEQCQSGRQLSNLAVAYMQGTNALYLRTKDVAGNYSSSERTVSYYYTQSAPSKVKNLQAVPPISTQNLFSFVWDLPDTFAGDANQLKYCYSINELPSSLNTTCTTNRYLAPFKAGTQLGTNIIYVVAQDEANNVDWNYPAAANFIADTISPGIPTNLMITDTSNRAVNNWALTLIWAKPTFEGNGIDHYVVERSENGHEFIKIGNVSNRAFVDISIEPEKNYYYRVRASDSVGNFGGASGVVSKSAIGRYNVPPEIVSTPVVRASFNQAEISWVTSRLSTSFVYYGPSPLSLDQSKGNLDLTTTHSVTVTGLTPRTLYYFKVQSFDLERDYDLANTYSGIMTFKTSESGNVSMVSAGDINLASAIITWQTSVPTRSRIESGKNLDYGLSAEETTGFGFNHILRLTGLDSGTLYHYRIVAEAENGGKFYSDDYQFTTIPYPVISNVRFQPVADSSTTAVEVTWNTNVLTDSTVSYRAPGITQEESKSEVETNHRVLVSDLASNAAYLFVVKGRDNYGNLATSEPQTWRSTFDTRAPKILETSIELTTIGVGKDAKAQMVISWRTDEPATSQVSYGSGTSGDLGKETAFDPQLTTNHIVVVPNLDLSQIYRVKPVSKDATGNAGYGEERIAVTQDRDFSVIELILGLLKGLLGE